MEGSETWPATVEAMSDMLFSLLLSAVSELWLWLWLLSWACADDAGGTCGMNREGTSEVPPCTTTGSLGALRVPRASCV